MAITRVYVVKPITGPKRLVRASSKSQAIGHCARSTFSAEVAGQDELIALAGSGTKVELANEETADGK